MSGPTPLTAYQQTYHWRNKNCGTWARDWIKTALPGIRVDDGKQSAEIVEVTNVTGDCDLGQRKGKLLTIYDLEVEMTWEGKGSDGEDVKGVVRVPEVSHEAIDGLSDYLYNISLTSTSTEPAEALVERLRTALPPLLSAKFNSLRPALLEAHAIPNNVDSPSASGTSTPANYTPAPPAKVEEKKETTKEKNTERTVGSTKTVEVNADLQASAADIWGLLTEEAKIPLWSRSPAQIQLTPGSAYSLFGGNVTGKIVSVDAPTKLVQTWQTKQPSWPSDHFGTMTFTLAQGSDSTKATFTLDGVPVGQETDIEKAINAFYIRGLKQMGLVLSTSSRSVSTPSSQSKRKVKSKPTKPPSSSSTSFSTSQIIGGGIVIGLSAVLVGLVYSSFPR